MKNLTTFNPYTQAAKDLSGIERVGGLSGNLNFRGFCWDCSKDKPKKGGKVFNSMPGIYGPKRFRCADCIEAKKTATKEPK